MKLKKIIKVKHKNPSEKSQKVVKKLLSDVSYWEYLSEGCRGDVYYFIVKNKIKFKNIDLKPGEYVLKIIRKEIWYRYPELNDYLKELSDLKLIPKIYYIDDSIMIMKYIRGKELFEKGPELSERSKKLVVDNLTKLLKRWRGRRRVHGDLHTGNVLVDQDLNVYLIDPAEIPLLDPTMDDFKEDRKDFLGLKRWLAEQ